MRHYLFVVCFIISSCLAIAGNNSLYSDSIANRIFIAHRGVNMRYTIAGENSIEAIGLAKRAGFGAIETDVRLTADGQLVVMHDKTLNRTCLNRDGSEIKDPVCVNHKTMQELRDNYKLKAVEPQMQSTIPTFHEYLLECKRQGLYTFIEPKLIDETGNHYREIIREADEVLGRGNYVITSNNAANVIIRDIGLYDVRLMGILYQTKFQPIEQLGNVIVAVSTTRFDASDYVHWIKESKAIGYSTESHADNFNSFDRINNNKIDYVSTDFLAPDYNGTGKVVLDITKVKDLMAYGSDGKKSKSLTKETTLTLREGKDRNLKFGGAYFEAEIDGMVEVCIGGQKFVVSGVGNKVKHQVMLYDRKADFSIKSLDDNLHIKNLRFRLVEY